MHKHVSVVGEFVAGVTALDADYDRNGRLHYTLHDSTDLPLEIDANSGVITASGTLTGSGQYSFTVRAEDGVCLSIMNVTHLKLNGSIHDFIIICDCISNEANMHWKKHWLRKMSGLSD